MTSLPPETLAAFAEITRAADRGDGWRHGWLGVSGGGKTTANRWLVRYVLESKKTDLVLTMDDKSAFHAEYEGSYRSNPTHLREKPPAAGEAQSHIVFRGSALTRNLADGCEPDDVARTAQEIVRFSPGRVLVNIDELADATTGGQAWRRDRGEESRIAQVFRKGRGIGISITWTTQVPQSLPREAFALSDTLGLFRLGGREVTYLLEKGVISNAVAAMLPTLPVGRFVLINRDVVSEEPRVFPIPPYERVAA